MLHIQVNAHLPSQIPVFPQPLVVYSLLFLGFGIGSVVIPAFSGQSPGFGTVRVAAFLEGDPTMNDSNRDCGDAPFRHCLITLTRLECMAGRVRLHAYSTLS